MVRIRPLQPKPSQSELAITGKSDYIAPMLTLDHSPVHSDPKILGGTLVFKGTRVKAQTLLDYIDAGDSLEDFLQDFPTVSKDDVILFLQLVREESNLG